MCALAVAGIAGCNSKPAADGEPAAAQPAAETAEEAAVDNRPERVVLTGIAVKTVDPAEPVDLMPQDMARQLGAVLTAGREFVRSESDVPPTHRPRQARLDITITYDVVQKDKSETVLTCAVEAELVWVDRQGGLTVRENVMAERPLSGSELTALPPGLVVAHVASTVEVAGTGILRKEQIRSAPPADVISAVDSEEPEIASWALSVVGDRHLTEGFDSAVAALDASAPEVRDAAIGALVALGDARAVQPLAQLANFSDHDQMRLAIESISAIGGSDALEYLEFVASGHPDDDIKQRAEEGIARIRKNPRAAAR